MRTNKLAVFSLLVVLCIGVTFVGCSETPSDPPDTTPKKTIPKSGSTYSYTRTEKEPDGTNTANTDSTHIVTSQSDVAAFAGKDSVVTFIDKNTMRASDNGDTMTIAYETNGDISIYRGNGIPGVPIPIPIEIPTWWTLPLKSKTAVTIIDLDTNIAINLGILTVNVTKVTGIASYIGAEPFLINGVDQKPERSDVIFSVKTSQGIDLTLRTSYWFSEKAGYFTQTETVNTYPSALITLAGLKPDNNVQILTGYTVK